MMAWKPWMKLVCDIGILWYKIERLFYLAFSRRPEEKRPPTQATTD